MNAKYLVLLAPNSASEYDSSGKEFFQWYQEVKEEKRRRDDVLSFVIREEARTTAVYKPKAAATMPLKNFLKGTTPYYC